MRGDVDRQRGKKEKNNPFGCSHFPLTRERSTEKELLNLKI